MPCRMRALALFAAMLPGAAVAQLVNGDFDSNLAGWTILDAGEAAWHASDADGDPASGSVMIRDSQPGNGGTRIVLSQCVPLAGVTFPVPVAAKARVQAEGEPQVAAYLYYREFNDTDCQVYVGFEQTRLVNNNMPAWLGFSDDYTPNGSGTNSVAVQLGIAKAIGTGSQGAVLFDDIVFGTAIDPVVLRRWTLDAGGGSAVGSNVELRGATIGQPDAGFAAGSSFAVQAGFWSSGGAGIDDRIFADGFEVP